ncbi:hypothetical protein C7N43_12080 [Sphingobacteriales bacterium UPWRP_1]|nr:hypothetical protein C7N43_12080 [Sphingobacteriales bacterium UPWRP_1]
MAKQNFLQLLRQKLSTGNRRSIHLSVLPGNLLNRVDVALLDLLQEKMALKLIDALLSKSKFAVTIQYDRPESLHRLPPDEQKNLLNLQKRLNALCYENNDNFLEHGIKPFGIGYPILIKRDRRDPSKLIKAPVLIWNLDIEKSATHAFKWTIKRDEDFAVYFNQVLLSHIETDEGISLQNIADAFNPDEPLTNQGIVDLCNQLLGQLNAGEEYPQATIAVCPGADTLKHLDFTKPVLRWSAVLGIYKTQKQSIIKDIDQLLKQQQLAGNENNNPHTTAVEEGSTADPNFGIVLQDNPAISASYQQHTFATVKTDPSQQAVVDNIAKYPRQIIQGPPGTGKSQSLTAVISNALDNNAKCLVVCEKRTALEVVQNNLKAIGLGALTVIIEDISKDRTKVVDIVRQQLEENMAPFYFAEQEYSDLLYAAQASREALNATHRFLAQKLLANWNWTELAGKFLQADEACGHATHLAAEGLHYSDFTFSTPEYQRLTELVNQGNALFAQTGSLQHPLQAINPMLFLRQNAGQLLFLLKEKGAAELAALQATIQLIENLTQDYAQALEVHYRQFYHQLLQMCNNLLTLLNNAIAQYGKQFDQRTGLPATSVKALGWVVGKFKNIGQLQQEAIGQYLQIQQYHAQYPYFSHQFITVSKEHPPTFTHVQNNVATLQNLLENWFNAIGQLIDRETQNLHYSAPHPAVPLQTQLQTACNTYRQLAQNHNKDSLLYDDMAEQTELPATQLMILHRTAQQWHTVLQNLHRFREFYDWQRFFLPLQPHEQQLLIALTGRQPNTWQCAFEQWYLHGLLKRNETPQTPGNDQNITRFATQLHQLQQLQAAKIVSQWKVKQHRAVTAFNVRNKNFNVKQLFNKRGSKGQQRTPLRTIIHADFGLFTDFFPVLLVNPVVCSSILPLKQGLFDVVIFDEASQLRLEETYTALLRGKHKIVSGDTHQMPPSDYFDSGNALLLDIALPETPDETTGEAAIPEETVVTDLLDKESLLAYAEDTGYSRSFLDFHYRSQHPHLIEFSNAAFYGSRLVNMPAAKPYKAIHLQEVNGAYDKNVNLPEVDAVMNILLNVIQPEATGPGGNPVFPSVGVATFNIYQRNLLLETIQQQKLENETAAARLTALEEQGLFVKNLENIQGDERDIMIISTTFGLKPDGRFLQNFGPINRAKGYKLLNVIITRARRQVYICTSIPQQYYSRYAAEMATSGNTGKAMLYAYLAYAKAADTGNEELRQNVLQLLRQYCTEQTAAHPELYGAESNLFITQIARRIQNALPQYRVMPFYKAGGFITDIAIFPQTGTQPPVAIECDNSAAHHSPEAYLHDVYRQEQLQKLGFRFYRTYSVNWWLHAGQALHELTSFVTAAPPLA